MRKLLIYLTIASIVSSGCGDDPSGSLTADLVVRNGVIRTLDERATVVEALAVHDGIILGAGSSSDLESFIGEDTALVDLQGRTVLPAFQDAHIHLIWSAADLLNVDLYSASTLDELYAAINTWADANPDATWIQGGGWDMAAFAGLLDRYGLDAVVPDRPAFLYSADGHTGWVNSLALDAAGITAATEDPEDGRIERDENGEPTGILQESAMNLVSDLVPGQPESQIDDGLQNGQWEANSYGITTIIDASVEDWMMAGYARAESRGELNIRVRGAAYVEPGDASAFDTILELRDRYFTDKVQINAVKLFIDGIIESQTAYMLEPYVDGTNGFPNFADDELNDVAISFDDAGFQLHAHAIGDAAVRQFLNAVDAVIATNGTRDRRALAAHLEVIDPDDLPRFAELGVFPDFQMLWAYPDPYITELTQPVIGDERSEWLYPIKAVQDAGATIVAGSDWSVSTMNPFEAMEVAITRQDPFDPSGDILTPQHRIDIETAVRAFTSNAAKATFTEDILGTLELGKIADFIVLSQDPFAVEPRDLSDIVVEQTWFEGEMIYQYGGSRFPSPKKRQSHEKGCR